MTDTVLSAAILFEKAKAFYRFSQYRQISAKSPDQDEALAVIVFSAFSAEAFLNELPEIANARREEDAIALVKRMRPLVQEKAPTEDKLFEASQCTSDVPLEKGKVPFQNFRLLIKLRDRIVHLKAGDNLQSLNEEHQKILTNLKNAGLSVDKLVKGINPSEDSYLPFVMTVSTQHVAKWSCNVVAVTLNKLTDNMRESDFKRLLKSYTNQHFQPLPDELPLDLLNWHKMIHSVGCTNLDELLQKLRKGELIIQKPH